jgi:hypothetical protein
LGLNQKKRKKQKKKRNLISAMEGNPVLALVQSLAPAVAYKESNFESNKKIWNLYAKVRPHPLRGSPGSRAP